jgi:hypothetical protein
VSKDVVFDENNSWDWSESLETADTVALEWGNKDEDEEHFTADNRANGGNSDQHVDHFTIVFNKANGGNSDQHRADSGNSDQHADPEMSTTDSYHNNSSNTHSSTISVSPTVQASSSENTRSRPERVRRRPL